MIAWNCDDSLVITAQERICYSSLIRVWKSHNGQLFHKLNDLHADEVNILETHPKDPRLLLSASHDGNIILWNTQTGRLIKKFFNRVILFYNLIKYN
jgi:WD40 repeat protein